MPSAEMREARPAVEFWLLAGLLVLVFLTGGSSRADVQSLQALRPIAILAAAYGLFTMRWQEWRQYRHIVFVLAAALALTIFHLIPLPPEVWRNLGGRGVIVDIDGLLDNQNQWRPLSMVPSGSLNALYSLSVPIAIVAFAVQLKAADHVRLLLLIAALTILTGILGFLQAIGFNFQVYAQSSENAGLFANRNHQGILLALLFPLLAVAPQWIDLPVRRHLVSILAVALALIALPLVIVNGSRAGLVAALLAIVSIPIVRLDRSRLRDTRNRWLLMIKAALGIGVCGVLIWLTVFASRDAALTRLQGSEDDIRFPVWASIVDVIHVYMPWGSGVGSYPDVYQILEPSSLLRSTFSNHAHNEWLEIAMTTGWAGIAMILWAFGLFCYCARQSLKVSGIEGMFSRLGLVIILALAFASTFDYPVRTPILSSVLAIAAVWAGSFRKFGRENGLP